MNALIKRSIVALSIVMIGLTGIVTDAEAARLGGKKSTGMQRSSQQTNQFPTQNSTTNATQRNPQQANNTAPNTAQKSSTARKWMGPLVGIASALGIAALLSHFGIGEGLASILTALLLAGLAFMVFKMVLNTFRAKKPQPAGTYGYSRDDKSSVGQTNTPSPFTPISTPTTAPLPSSTDTVMPKAASHVNPDEFLRAAKGFFIRLQAANNKKDTDDLRRFMTPEMFAEAQLQIAERGNTEQTTEILQMNATLLSIVTEGTHDIGSVRFTGQIKCSDQVMAENFSEVWHFSKWSNHTDQWSLAGIQQD